MDRPGVCMKAAATAPGGRHCEYRQKTGCLGACEREWLHTVGSGPAPPEKGRSGKTGDCPKQKLFVLESGRQGGQVVGPPVKGRGRAGGGGTAQRGVLSRLVLAGATQERPT